jgi:hypothetical protein
MSHCEPSRVTKISRGIFQAEDSRRQATTPHPPAHTRQALSVICGPIMRQAQVEGASSLNPNAGNCASQSRSGLRHKSVRAPLPDRATFWSSESRAHSDSKGHRNTTETTCRNSFPCFRDCFHILSALKPEVQIGQDRQEKRSSFKARI